MSTDLNIHPVCRHCGHPKGEHIADTLDCPEGFEKYETDSEQPTFDADDTASDARTAINRLQIIAAFWRKKCEKQEITLRKYDEALSRQRELPKDAKDGHYIDGHPIEYWHQIAKSALKTNNTLIDRLKEKERINADLEQQLKSAEIAADSYRETIKIERKARDHQSACATKAENERDAALRELDAMREKLQHAQRQMDIAKTALLNT